MEKEQIAIVIGEKIKEYRKQNGWTQQQLGEKIGISKNAIGNYEKGFRSPKKDTMFDLANAFNIYIDDLFPPINKDTSTTIQRINATLEKLDEPRQLNVLTYSEKQLDEQERAEREVSEKVVSLYDIEATSATAAAPGFGYGFGYDDSDRETIQVDERPPRHDIATRVSGDSMEPDYHDGDILYLIDKGLTTYNGELAVIAYGDRSYFKKIYTEKGHLRLVSLNDKYEDIILDFPPAEDTHIKIFAVVGRYGKELDKN